MTRKMKAARTVVLASLVILFAAPAALADNRPFGLGIVIGEPTGLSLKSWLSERNAIDGAIAWSVEGDNDLQLQADYVFHNFDLITVEKGKFPLYFGIGVRFAFRENKDDRLGLRIPVGLDYIFAGERFDAFLEIVPVMDLVPDTDFDLEGAIGARYFF